MDRGAWRATVHGAGRVRHNLVTKPLPQNTCVGIPQYCIQVIPKVYLHVLCFYLTFLLLIALQLIDQLLGSQVN